ncbi:MAG: Bifunctional PGK/TIM [Chlamydiae bacterium]|nr:Bifunctional PGK/TIM [Chlamydiota bacterium]
MFKKTLKDIALDNQKVLMRADFNLPLSADGSIVDDFRIRSALPTIEYLLDHNCALVLMSHFKRPGGRYDSRLSLKVCAERLSSLLGKQVKMAPDCVGPEVDQLKQSLHPGEILMLENLRFHSEETGENKQEFSRKLAEGCSVFVNDAFGCCHRHQASIVDIAKCFPETAVAGFLLQKEQEYFDRYLLNPKGSLTAIVGGVKVSTKIGVLKSLIERVDTLLIGGAMANTFLKAKGFNLGYSLIEEDYIGAAGEIIRECEKRGLNIVLPQDLLFTDHIFEGGQTQVLDINMQIPEHLIAVDIGPKTIEEFSKKLDRAEIVFWNGPLGVCEVEAFSTGTKMIAQKLSQVNGVKVIGGGDSAAAIRKMNLQNCFDHISTGGGASLEFLENGHLPGIDALSSKK